MVKFHDIIFINLNCVEKGFVFVRSRMNSSFNFTSIFEWNNMFLIFLRGSTSLETIIKQLCIACRVIKWGSHTRRNENEQKVCWTWIEWNFKIDMDITWIAPYRLYSSKDNVSFILSSCSKKNINIIREKIWTVERNLHFCEIASFRNAAQKVCK